MTEYTYYIDSESGLIAYDYYEIVHALDRGLVSLGTKVLIYDPLTREKNRTTIKNIL